MQQFLGHILCGLGAGHRQRRVDFDPAPRQVVAHRHVGMHLLAVADREIEPQTAQPGGIFVCLRRMLVFPVKVAESPQRRACACCNVPPQVRRCDMPGSAVVAFGTFVFG